MSAVSSRMMLCFSALTGVASLLASTTVFAASCGGAETNVIACSDSGGGSIWQLLELGINILASVVGLAAIGGIVYGAMLYTTAQNNASQITKAKITITNVVVGLVLFAGMYSFIQYLIPGGVFDRNYSVPTASNNSSSSGSSSTNDNKDPATTTKTGTLTHLHFSGRFDRSVDQWKSDLRGLNERFQPSVITLTEADNGRDRAINWSGWNNSKGESIIAWKTSVWRRVDSASWELAPNTPSKLPSYLKMVVLEHRASKTKWMWFVSHVPAHVDGGNGRFRVTDPDYTQEFIHSQVAKWKATMPHIASLVGQSIQKYNIKRSHTVITADWNIDLAQRGWRDIMKGYFPNFKPSNPVGSRGTHGNRTIDTSFVANNTNVVAWRGFGDFPSSDHKPFLAKYNAGD